MVQPDLILIDLNLPRAEGLRVISRVRGNADYNKVALGLMWQSPIEIASFQQHVIRAVRDSSFGDNELRRAMARELSPGGAVYGTLMQTAA